MDDQSVITEKRISDQQLSTTKKDVSGQLVSTVKKISGIVFLLRRIISVDNWSLTAEKRISGQHIFYCGE